jgi:RES domain-containing protein
VTSLFRICRRKFAASAFSGEGARLYGGRWNHLGVSVVYCASSPALAQLEYLVHVDRSEAPDDLVVIPGSIPDGVLVQRWAVSSLPADWRQYPGPPELRDRGSRWVNGRTAVALEVPSVVSPTEHDLLINPAHPEFGKIRFEAPLDLIFDPRLF